MSSESLDPKELKLLLTSAVQPMTIRDFMNYLIYIEHSAENLQFFLWYRDYVRRFRDAQTADKPLAPEWTQSMEDDALSKIMKEAADKMKKEASAADIFKGTDFEKGRGEHIIDCRDPFTTPPRTAGSRDDASTVFSDSQATMYRSQIQDTFAAVGAKQPCKSRTPG